MIAQANNAGLLNV